MIHNYSMQVNYIQPKEEKDEDGNEKKTWRPSQSVLDRKVKDVVSKVEKQL
jgi:hypothetical protein